MHVHCHHKAIMGAQPELDVLRKLGLDFRIPASGCCGMAGAFGFEADKYDLSMQIGEHALLPAVRDADHATLLVADGFSCRHQIRQATGRTAMHPAQVLAMAFRGERAVRDGYPLPDRPREAVLAGAALLAGGALGWAVLRRVMR